MILAETSPSAVLEHMEQHRFIINDYFICCVYIPKRVLFSYFAVSHTSNSSTVLGIILLRAAGQFPQFLYSLSL